MRRKFKNLIARILFFTKLRQTRKIGRNFSSSNKSEKTITYFSNLPTFPTRIYNSYTKSELIKCQKAGGWTQIPKWAPKSLAWQPRNLSHFGKTLKGNNGVGYFVDGFSLKIRENIEIIPNYYGGSSLNLYSFKESKKTQNLITLDSAFCLLVNGSNYFQHFIQDTLPILMIAYNYLIDNPSTPILTLKPNFEFRNRSFFFEILNLKNPIVEIDNNKNMFLNNLIYVDVNPCNLLYLDFSMGLNLLSRYFNLFEFSIKKQEPNLVYFFKRNSRTRHLISEEKIINELQSWSKRNNFEFMVIDTLNTSRDLILSLMQRAKVGFGVMGGANYNCLGMPKNSYFVEFIPTSTTDSLNYFISSLGLNYFPLPVKARVNDPNWDIPLTLLENCLLDLQNRITTSN